MTISLPLLFHHNECSSYSTNIPMTTHMKYHCFQIWVNNNLLWIYGSTILCLIHSNNIAIIPLFPIIYPYMIIYPLITSPFIKVNTHIVPLKPSLFRSFQGLFLYVPIHITFPQGFSTVPFCQGFSHENTPGLLQLPSGAASRKPLPGSRGPSRHCLGEVLGMSGFHRFLVGSW